MKSKSFFCLPSLFLLLGCSLSCKNKIEQRVSEQYQDSIELRKSIHMCKCYAYHLIANDSVKEGIHILDSLWQTHHLDDMIPCGIGAAYYKLGEYDSAFYWFQVSEAYIDSMMEIQPSEKWLRDKLPLAYILRGKEAALEVKMSMSEESKEQARVFFETCPTPKDFLENAVLTVFNSFKSNDYAR